MEYFFYHQCYNCIYGCFAFDQKRRRLSLGWRMIICPIFEQFIEFDALYIQIRMAKRQKQEQIYQSQGLQNEGINSASGELHHFSSFLKFKINKYNAFCVELVLFIALKLSLPIHSLVAYLLLTRNDLQQPLNQLLHAISGNGIASLMLQASHYLLKAMEIAAVYAQVRFGEASIASKIGRKIVRNFNILVQVDLAMSAFMLMGNFWQNLASFILAAASTFFYSFFLANYFDRKDQLYLSSVRDQLLLTAMSVGSLFLNAVFVQFAHLNLLILVDFFLSLGLFGWYVRNGFLLVVSPTLRFYLQAIVIGKLAFALNFLDCFFTGRVVGLQGLLFRLALLCSVIYLSSRAWNTNMRLFQSMLVAHGSSIKRFDIFLTALGEAGSRERDLFTNSMLASRWGCKETRIYDFSSQTDVTTRQTTREAELRVHIRRLYQQALKMSQDTQSMLDFCEFILNEFNNPFELCRLMTAVKPKGWIDQLRATKLRLLLKDSNTAFNGILFDGKMDVQHMIIAEQTFDRITNRIEAILMLQLSIWRAIGGASINMTDVRGQIEEKLSLLRQTSREWGCIGKYLRFQKRWRYIYINYSFFLLNERLFYKDTEQFKNFNEDNYFLGESTLLFENDAREKLFNESLLFDKKAFYIRARLNAGILEIINVSRYFQHFVEYNQEEIVGSPINLLMTEEIKWTHDERVLEWLEAGSCTNQANYSPIFTSFLTKNGEEVPAVKYFKLYVEIAAPQMLEFICLLKVNQQQAIDNDEEDIDTEQSISSKAINRDFSTTKRSTLKLENNIFIKQQNLRPNASIQEIDQAKRAIRLLTLTITALIFMLLFVTRSDTDTINANITQFLNFLNLYRFPMALSKNYMKNFLSIGTQSSVISQITLQTQSFLAFNSDALTLKTLFDESLNVPASYGPFLNDSFNKGLSYDQVEIYSVIISSITSLARLPINRTGYDFAMLNMYLIPSYDHMINATKIKFHQTFQNNLNRMLIDQIIVAATETVIFILIVVFVGVKIAKYFKKGRSVLQIVFDFSDLNVRRVERYWKNILRHFQKLHIRNKAFCLSTSLSLRATQKLQIQLDIDTMRMRMQGEQNISCNKKQKHVFQTKKAKNRATRAIIGIGIALLLLITGVLSIEISNIVQIIRLQSFQNDGFYFLRYYPATSVLGHALMERYYNQVYPKQIKYFPSRYQEYISAMYLIGQSSYIGSEEDATSSYYQKRKNYMFGNPCTFAPQVLTAASSNMSTCMSAYNKTLSGGITTLLRAAHPQVEMYINQKINLTTSQLNDITTSLTLVAYFVTDAITTWAGEFSAKVTQYESLDTLFCLIAVGGVLILHFIFCEKFLFYFLESDYEFIREVFDKMIPNFIISVEKVIRQRFVMEGIIKQG